MIRKSLSQNGSPDPIFETDSERSYFQVTLKSHPDFVISQAKVERSNEGTNREVNEGTNNIENQALYANEVVKLIYNKEIEKVIEGVIEGTNTRMKPKLVKVLNAIIINENKRVPEYVEMTRLNVKSVERYIKILREGGLIDFTDGGKKVGGYYITDKAKKKLSHYSLIRNRLVFEK